MTNRLALDLMESAWAARRASFDATETDRREALTAARGELITAATMLRDHGPPDSYAHALHLRAHVELDLGRLAAAQTLWEEAVAVLRESEDVLALAHKVRHLGDLHRQRGRLGQAEAHYREALGLYRRHDGSSGLDYANAVSRMADLKERLGEDEEALTLWQETRERYAALSISPGVEEAEEHITRLMGRRCE